MQESIHGLSEKNLSEKTLIFIYQTPWKRNVHVHPTPAPGKESLSESLILKVPKHGIFVSEIRKIRLEFNC